MPARCREAARLPRLEPERPAARPALARRKGLMPAAASSSREPDMRAEAAAHRDHHRPDARAPTQPQPAVPRSNGERAADGTAPAARSAPAGRTPPGLQALAAAFD